MAERFRLTRRAAANDVKHKLTAIHPLLVSLVEEKLMLRWSPEQTAGWLKATGHAMCVCAQTIYDWVYLTRADLRIYLRSQKQKYRRTRANTLRKQQRAKLFAARRIDQRPVAVAGRRFYGHWEGDTMVSCQGKPGRIGTLAERKSGYLVAFLLPNGESRGFAAAAARALTRSGIPAPYLKTMTLDNGSEMQSYELLERLTPLSVFFAYPYHSWERGTNENTNGLLRQYFPKGSDLGLAAQVQLDLTVQLLNTRPRKRLGYKTPAEMFETKW
jgi:transposase, IS30 family